MIIFTVLLFTYNCLFIIVFVSDVKYDMRAGGVSVSVAGTALKQFFSELLEPVIPQSLYDELRDAVSKLTDCCYSSDLNITAVTVVQFGLVGNIVRRIDAWLG